MIGAVFITPAVQSILYNVTPTDPAQLQRRRGLPHLRGDRSELHSCTPRHGGGSDRRDQKRLTGPSDRADSHGHDSTGLGSILWSVQIELPFLRTPVLPS